MTRKTYRSMPEPTPIKKARKPRKKMTEEQRLAAAERLAKARAAKGPSQNKSIHEDVLALSEDNVLSYKNVKAWINENQDLLKAIKHFKKSNDRKEIARYYFVESYILQLQKYLRTGVYESLFYGNQAQHQIYFRVTHMAYNKDGTPKKRNIGWFYPDIGIYTEELRDEGV